MARESFNRRVALLKDEVLILGSMVEEAIHKSVDALIRHDPVTARSVYQNDQAINEKRFAIENAVLIQIATQQPMARDLRSLAAILEIIGELERMGDYAKGISKVIMLLQDTWVAIPAAELSKMSQVGIAMLHQSLAAFADNDIETAELVARGDDEMDLLYRRVYQKIVNAMIADPSTIDQANHLLWVAHNLERLGDRVVNVCERTIFTCTGDLFELDVEEENETIS